MINIAQKYLLDEMLSGKEAICRNLVRQNKDLIHLPRNMKGIEDRKIVQYAKRNNYALITKDKKCAAYARQLSVKTILVKD